MFKVYLFNCTIIRQLFTQFYSTEHVTKLYSVVFQHSNLINKHTNKQNKTSKLQTNKIKYQSYIA